MTGETEADVSGWTVDTLKQHLERLLDERDARYEQRFLAQEKAVTQALSAADKATTKAETAADKRFDAVNEFRQTLTDQTATFIPRTEAEAADKRNAEDIAALKGWRENLTGVATGGQASTVERRASVGMIAAAVGLSMTLVFGVIGILVAVLAR